MKSMQKGFTLIELVVVLVILGILAATAVPRFINLSAEANQAALDGVKGAVESASAINFAAAKAGNAGATTIGGGEACNTVIPAIMQGGTMPDGYFASGTVGTGGSGDTDTSCTVVQDSNNNGTADTGELTTLVTLILTE